MKEFVQVDAFTDRPFRGNPAAVLVMDGPADDAWMQAVASEMNLSETAFCHPLPDATHGKAGEWELRWFTPTVEVDLCGHATLATSPTFPVSPLDKTISYLCGQRFWVAYHDPSDAN